MNLLNISDRLIFLLLNFTPKAKLCFSANLPPNTNNKAAAPASSPDRFPLTASVCLKPIYNMSVIWYFHLFLSFSAFAWRHWKRTECSGLCRERSGVRRMLQLQSRSGNAAVALALTCGCEGASIREASTRGPRWNCLPLPSPQRGFSWWCCRPSWPPLLVNLSSNAEPAVKGPRLTRGSAGASRGRCGRRGQLKWNRDRRADRDSGSVGGSISLMNNAEVRTATV